MKMYKFSWVLLVFGLFVNAQQLRTLNEEKSDVSFRGLAVLDNSVFWVSGTKGTVGMSFNGGKTMKWVSPKGYEDRDFRDIHAWDHKTVVIMAVGSPGVILKTKDGGNTWYKVFKDESPNVFFNSMDFYERNENLGVLIGTPAHGQPYMLVTKNKGELWEKVSATDQYPHLNSGESFFAASGGNIKLINDSVSLMVSAGASSHLIMNSQPFFKHPLDKKHSETAGANSMDYSTFENYGIIVGGDFLQPDSSHNNIFVFDYDRQNKPVFRIPETAPKGYKSGVTIIGHSKAVACGVSGVDVSYDKGQNWNLISTESFHVCQRAKNGNKVYLAGPDGKIGVLD
ncbi:MAG: YCF48-related protein [Moheibacter sp.]